MGIPRVGGRGPRSLTRCDLSVTRLFVEMTQFDVNSALEVYCYSDRPQFAPVCSAFFFAFVRLLGFIVYHREILATRFCGSQKELAFRSKTILCQPPAVVKQAEQGTSELADHAPLEGLRRIPSVNQPSQSRWQSRRQSGLADPFDWTTGLGLGMSRASVVVWSLYSIVALL